MSACWAPGGGWAWAERVVWTSRWEPDTRLGKGRGLGEAAASPRELWGGRGDGR